MSLRARIRAGEPMVGTVLALPDPSLAELGAAPFDLVWLDLEHGALDVRDVQALTIAVQHRGCGAAVRLPRWDYDRVAAVIDAGPDALVVPGVESVAQVRRVVEQLRYPPDGRRGYGPRRAGGYGRHEVDQPACLVQVETLGAVASAREIAAVDGVDALVVGSTDLSYALGDPHRLDTAEMHAAVAEASDAALAARIAFGVAGSGPPEELDALAGAVATLLVYSVDVRLYAQAMDAVAARLRERHVRV